MTEAWLPVSGYEGRYEVSNLGNVRSLDRVVQTSDGPRRYRGRPLKPYPNSHGHHLLVTLSNEANQRKKFLVHRLVLTAFSGGSPPGGQALHRNDVPTDNRVENLYWGDYSDNMADRVRNGIHHYCKRTHCKRGHKILGVKPNGGRFCLECSEMGKKRRASA